MSDIDYERQIREGKQIVTDYIQKERPDYARRIDALDWSPKDPNTNIYLLVLFVGGKRHMIPIDHNALADAPGTPGGGRPLKEKVDQFFAELQLHG